MMVIWGKFCYRKGVGNILTKEVTKQYRTERGKVGRYLGEEISRQKKQPLQIP